MNSMEYTKLARNVCSMPALGGWNYLFGLGGYARNSLQSGNRITKMDQRRDATVVPEVACVSRTSSRAIRLCQEGKADIINKK